MSSDKVFLGHICKNMQKRLEEIEGKEIYGKYFYYKVMKQIELSSELFDRLTSEIKDNINVTINENHDVEVENVDLWNFVPSGDFCNLFQMYYFDILQDVEFVKKSDFYEESSILNESDLRIIKSLSNENIANHVKFILNIWHFFVTKQNLSAESAVNAVLLIFIKLHFKEGFEEISDDALFYINQIMKIYFSENNSIAEYDFTRLREDYLQLVSFDELSKY